MVVEDSSASASFLLIALFNPLLNSSIRGLVKTLDLTVEYVQLEAYI